MQYLLWPLFVLVVAGPAGAAPGDPVGTEFQVNTYTTGSQYRPAVGPDGGDGFVVVWQSGSYVDGYDVIGQRFASTGEISGLEFRVNTYTADSQSSAAVGADGDGGFVVAWSSFGSYGTDTECASVQGQRFTSTGSPVGTEFQVNTYTTACQSSPAVAPDGGGGFVVVWDSDGSSGTDAAQESIQAQRFTSVGAPTGPEFQVNKYTTDRQYLAAVAPDGSGGFVVVWSSHGSSGTDTSEYSVQGQRFTSTGIPVGPESQVNTYTAGYQIGPAVAPDGGGGFVVVWDSDGSSGTDTDGYSVQAQRFASTGEPVGPEFQVNTYTTGNQGGAAVAPDGTGGFVVVWASNGFDQQAQRFWTIQGQRFGSTGTPVGSEFQVSTHTTFMQWLPAVSADGSGGFVVVWTSYGSTGTDTDSWSIQGQRFEGIETTTTTTLPTTTTTLPLLPGDGRGRPERDCYIGLGGYSEADLVPINKKGKKVGIVCTDCDPTCDLDGVAEPNGSCTFSIGVCVNQPGIPGCDPDRRWPKKIKATAKSKAGKLDLSSTLPSDGGSACSAFVDFPVPVKGRKQNKTGKGKVTLLATKPKDRDVFEFRCEPWPGGRPCPTCVTTSGTFCDLGDGTVYDGATDLMWEKKTTSGSGGLHDVDNQYSWAGRCTISGALCQPDAAAAATCAAQTDGALGCAECGGDEGTCDVDSSEGRAITTVWHWINQLNAENFAGYNDWRLPWQAGSGPSCPGCARELVSILDLGAPGCGAGGPCIDPIFGPTVTVNYWSASTYPADPSSAWHVGVYGGLLGGVNWSRKYFEFGVRAVHPGW